MCSSWTRRTRCSATESWGTSVWPDLKCKFVTFTSQLSILIPFFSRVLNRSEKQERWGKLFIMLSKVFLLIDWLSEIFSGMSPTTWSPITFHQASLLLSPGLGNLSFYLNLNLLMFDLLWATRLWLSLLRLLSKLFIGWFEFSLQGAVMSFEIGWNLNSEQCLDILDWRQMMRRFSSNSYLWQKQTSQTFK